MAVPTTREDFKLYCMRKIGWPTIDIAIDDSQIEDRIDEALQYYRDYHYNGSEHIYLKHQVTQDDVTNGYFTIGDPLVFAVTSLFSIGNLVNYNSDIFSINYQIALNDIWNLSSFSLIPYYLAREQLSLIQEMLVGKQPIRFNQLTNQIHVDMTWENVTVGQFMVFEGYKTLDPDTYSTIWSDRWLQNYCAVLIKQSWGEILTKYSDMELIGGKKFNATRILDDAQKERAKLEEEMIYSFSMPVLDQVG